MSFLDDITGIFSGGGIIPSLVKTVSMGYVLNKLSTSATASNQSGSTTGQNAPSIDNGVRLQVSPAPDQRIPILYGTAYFGGIISEAQMSNSNQTMTYVLTLAEKTGTIYSSGNASVYTFKTIHWNDQQVYFQTDGITIDHTIDNSGNRDDSLNGLVKIWCYAGGSASTNQIIPDGYTNASRTNAYANVPTWTSGDQMSNLIFAVVQVNYSAERNIKGIGDVKFQIANTMNKPGDVIYDYLTNAMYGAGVSSHDIDTTTLSTLNTYAATSVNYVDETGTHTLTNRYQINGLVDTAQQVMKNVEGLASSAGSWLSYNITTGQWGVIINKTGTSVASFNDKNILSSISVTGTGLQDLYNEVKVEYPNRDIKDTTDYVQISIPSIDRNANEEDNTLNLSYPFINEPVQAQLLGFIELKQSRIDLIIKFTCDFTYINLGAGEIIDVTNSKLGFTNKLFRIISIAEKQGDEALQSEITALEYDSTVYGEDLTRYTRTSSTGIITSGNISVPGTPTITTYQLDARPRIVINSTAPTNGIIEGMEYWLTNDVGLGEAQRSYRLIAIKKPTNGNSIVRGTFTAGENVQLDYDTLGTGNLIVKTRAYNSTTVGPYSSPSATTNFVATQTTDAVGPNTQLQNELGQLVTAYTVFSLLNKVNGLFGNSATSAGGIFSTIKDILFPNTTSSSNTVEGQLASSPTFSNTIQYQIVNTTNNLASNSSFITAVGQQTANIGSYSIDALKDVNTTDYVPVTNKSVLAWNGTNWVPAETCCPSLTFSANTAGGGGNVTPTTYYLSVVKKLPYDYSDWQAAQEEDVINKPDWTPTQAPQTGSYYVYFSGSATSYGTNEPNKIYAPLTLGSSGNAKIYKSDGTLVETVTVSSMSVSNNRLEIPFADRENGVNYYVLLTEGLVKYCEAISPAFASPRIWNFNTPYYPISAPSPDAGVLDSLSNPSLPSYNANLTITNISHTTLQCPAANLLITFSESVLPNSGLIAVYEGTNTSGTLVTNITASSGVANVNTINYGPISGLAYDKSYYIDVPAGVAITNRGDTTIMVCGVSASTIAPQVTNLTNNKQFNTANTLVMTSYTLTTLDPTTGNIISDPTYQAVDVQSDLTINFNRPIYRANGDPLSISINKSSGELHQVFNLKSSWNGTTDLTSEIVKISDGGTSFSLNPTKDFEPYTEYFCAIPNNILTDSCGTFYAGTTVTWKTRGFGQAVTTYPTNSSSNVTVNDTGIAFTFTEPVVPGYGRVIVYDSANNEVANLASTDSNVTFN